MNTPKTIINTQFDRIPQWQKATWEEYLAYCEEPNIGEVRVFYNNGDLFVHMGNEGINHSIFTRLFAIIFWLWFSNKSERTFQDMGGCVIEKPETQGASPDLILYIGEGYPTWKEGKSRRVNLNNWRVPDLVGEVADTTLATDLDEKKKLYAELKIPEYWVIDIQGKRAIAFVLKPDGKYQQSAYSEALKGLPIALLEATLKQLEKGTNSTAANWFAAEIAKL